MFHKFIFILMENFDQFENLDWSEFDSLVSNFKLTEENQKHKDKISNTKSHKYLCNENLVEINNFATNVSKIHFLQSKQFKRISDKMYIYIYIYKLENGFNRIQFHLNFTILQKKILRF